jgi:hypothetical protein
MQYDPECAPMALRCDECLTVQMTGPLTAGSGWAQHTGTGSTPNVSLCVVRAIWSSGVISGIGIPSSVANVSENCGILGEWMKEWSDRIVVWLVDWYYLSSKFNNGSFISIYGNLCCDNSWHDRVCRWFGIDHDWIINNQCHQLVMLLLWYW